MRPLAITLSLVLLPALAAGRAQQKPVLSAQPAPSPAPEAPMTTAAGPPPAVASNYVIGPEDSLQITIFNNANLSATEPVRPDGKITLPLIGDVVAAGLTPTQLSADIAEKLKKFVNEPTADVTVLAVNSKRVFLVGEIARVGPLPLTPGMTVLQAISSAGGPTPFANKKHIYILRGEAGKEQKIPFDYKKALKGDMQGVTLNPGDTIVLP